METSLASKYAEIRFWSENKLIYDNNNIHKVQLWWCNKAQWKISRRRQSLYKELIARPNVSSLWKFHCNTHNKTMVKLAKI